MKEKLKKFWIIPILCAIMVSMFVFKSTPEPESMFKSSAILHIDRGNYPVNPISGFDEVVAANNFVDKYENIIKSTEVLFSACKDAGLIGNEYLPEDILGNKWLNDKLRNISGDIEISRVGDSDLMKIEFTGESGVLTRDFVNCLAQSLIEYDKRMKNRPYREKSDQLKLFLAKAKQDLVDSEQRMEEFQVENPAFIAFNEEEYLNLRERLRIISEKKTMLELQVAQMKDRLSLSEDNYIDWLSGEEENESLSILNKRLVELQLEKEEMLVYQTAKSPDVINLEIKISKIVNNLIKELEANLNSLILEEQALKEKIVLAPQNEKKMRQLKREFELNEELYSKIYRELEKNKLAQADVISSISILEYAANSVEISHYKRHLQAFAGTMSGFLLGVLLIDLLILIYNKVCLIGKYLIHKVLSIFNRAQFFVFERTKGSLYLLEKVDNRLYDMELSPVELFDIVLTPQIQAYSADSQKETGCDGILLLEDNEILLMPICIPESQKGTPGKLGQKENRGWSFQFRLKYQDLMVYKLQNVKQINIRKKNKFLDFEGFPLFEISDNSHIGDNKTDLLNLINYKGEKSSSNNDLNYPGVKLVFN